MEPRGYETRLDEGLLSLVPQDLSVVRSRSWSPARTRRFGIGDLGLRSLTGLGRAASALLASRTFDAVYVTTYPIYPALLGPYLKRRFSVPFVLDLQDPWVGSWGKSVGPGARDRADLKSRCSRAAAWALELWIAPRADAITAVSRGTFDELATRHPDVGGTPFLELPIGADAADVSAAAADGVNRCFVPSDGVIHICSVGTILPRGAAVLEAVLRALGSVRTRRPDVFGRLRLHFVGTSNQTDPGAPPRVRPIAERLGVAASIDETPPRVDYLDALAIQRDADVLLLLGSDEPHYTASKVYPALMVARPIIAVYHSASPVIDALRRVGPVPPISIVSFDERGITEAHQDQIAAAIIAAADHPAASNGHPSDRLGADAAPRLAARFAAFLESLCPPSA